MSRIGNDQNFWDKLVCKAIEAHFSYTSQWSKIYFEYPRIILKEKRTDIVNFQLILRFELFPLTMCTLHRPFRKHLRCFSWKSKLVSMQVGISKWWVWRKFGEVATGLLDTPLLALFASDGWENVMNGWMGCLGFLFLCGRCEHA